MVMDLLVTPYFKSEWLVCSILHPVVCQFVVFVDPQELKDVKII